MRFFENYGNGNINHGLFRLEMFIDDRQVDKGTLPRDGTEISVREDQGLFLGGIPDKRKVGEMLAVTQSLDGCISDVVIRGS